MKKEIVWLDYARLIGILLVVFGHGLQRIPEWNESVIIKGLWHYIYLFHMPVFFMISGFLYKQNRGEGLRVGGGKIFYALILPYLIYQFAYTPFFLVGHRDEIANPIVWMKMIMGIIDGDGYNTPFSMYVCLPCWFIVSIIQLRILFLFVPINKISTSMLTLFALIFLVMRKLLNIDLYFCVDSTIMAIPYFLAGYFLRKKMDLLQSISNIRLLFGALLFGVIVYVDLVMNGAAQMNGPSYGNSILANYLAGFSGSLMLFLISIFMAKILHENSFVKTISRNTLFIIFFHWVMLVFLGRILHFKFLYEIGNLGYILCSFALSAFILTISYFVITLWGDKYTLVFGKKKYE